MNSLMLHELKKLFSKKILIFALFFLLFTNGFTIFQANNQYRDPINSLYDETAWQVYKTVEGKMDAKKISKLFAYRDQLQAVASGTGNISEYYLNLTSDTIIVNNLIDKLQKTYQYADDMTQLLNNNTTQLAIYQEKGNEYLVKQAELTAKTYSGRGINSFYDVDTYNTYFNYDFSSFLILLLIFFATSSLYAGEEEAGMLSLMRSTSGGRLRLSNAKLAASAIFTGLVCLAFFACDFLFFLWCKRLVGASNPLYSISDFAYTPLNISIGGFSLLSCFCKYLGILCFSLISCLFSTVLKKSYLTFVVDFIFCMGCMALSTYGGGALDYLNLANPINLLTCRNLFSSFYVVNIFGTPVFRYIVVFLCIFALLGVLYALVSLLNMPNTRRQRK